ncbi:PTS system trehalose-specific EIIBC component [Aerococcus vaginalis]
MGKYEQDAKTLFEAIGGEANIHSVTHCATRMRFVLNDDDAAERDTIDDIPSVKGMFTNAGQFQVIIGNDVANFYNDFVAVTGIDGVSEGESKRQAAKNQNWLQKIVGVLAEIFTPIIPAIIVGGLILGFRNILGEVQFGGATIAEQSVFWKGVYDFLWLPGEAIFHFLPVGITWSVTKKMGTTQILGIILGITLVSPQLLNAYDVVKVAASDIPVWDFGFAQVSMVGYQAQVIPAMMAGFLLAYLEKGWRKVIPESVSMIFVPLFSLLPTLIIAHAFLGPIGWTIGTWISKIVNLGLTSSISWLFGGLFGFAYAPLVVTGLHHTTLAIDTQLIADFQSTNLWPIIALSNIAQGAAVLGVIVAHRDNKKEQSVAVPSFISAWLGVTEPAMFGINLKFLYPFVAGMIGGGAAGTISTILGVRALSIGVGGIPGILAIRPGDYISFIISTAVAIVVPFILTLVMEKRGIMVKEGAKVADIEKADEPEAETLAVAAATPETADELVEEVIFAPVNGEFIPITDVDDPVFSQKLMGDGFAVKPTDGEVYAPVFGKVTNIFDTKHAIGLLTEGGVEVLVHMGLDTVALNGESFDIKIKEGDEITPDTLIAEVDLDQIKASDKATDIIVAFTNMRETSEWAITADNEVTAKATVGDLKF